ncbi:MAG: PEGA domain-containing protein [Candidatus Schekmanbacteria bacterium]|nr:PEGA domain-containing protein [Candidatus Schekmanbacteria bacterium]
MRYFDFSRKRVALAAGIAAVLFSTAAAAPVIADESLAAQLDAATQKYAAGDYPLAILMLGEAIRGLGARFQAAGGDSQARDALVRAYELRAQAYIAIGELDRAKEDFRQLLTLNASWKLEGAAVSLKLVELFESVRVELVGYLTVQSEPSGARVLLDGAPVGATPLYSVPLVRGTYDLSVEAEGYLPFTERLAIPADVAVERTTTLKLNSGTCIFITKPSGVEVRIDDKLAGITAGGLVPAEDAALAEQFGIDPAEFSVPLRITLVTPGSHRVSLSKPCFETQDYKIDVEIRDNLFKPATLQESHARLAVASTPSGAEIFVNDELKGVTPQNDLQICSGSSTVRVSSRDGSWRYEQQIAPRRNERLEIQATPRPTLTYLGVVPSERSSVELVRDLDARLREQLGRLSTVNVRIDSEEAAVALRNLELSREILALSADSSAAKQQSLVDRLEKSASSLQTDLLLLAALPNEELQRTLKLFLFSRRHAKPDRKDVLFLNPEALEQALGRLDLEAPVVAPWAGFVTVDSMLSPYPTVVLVNPSGPAAAAGIRVGDRISAIGGLATKSSRALYSQLASLAAGQSADIAIDGAAQASTHVRLVMQTTLLEIPLNDRRLYYNRLLEDNLLRAGVAAGDQVQRSLHLFNAGIAFLHFDQALQAIEMGFSRAALPSGPGVSAGTVQYYLGECYRRLGYTKDAVAAFKRAAEDKQATFSSVDGASVSEKALLELEEIGSGR